MTKATSFEANQERLYALLPAIHRIRDLSEGEPLRALLAILEQEFQTLERDVEGLYENWFIETCDEWVVPYIGDLLDVRELYARGGRYGQQERRAYVANTLAYRRRKGTVPVLEQLVQDITGWRSRAVEFFKLLATTQNINHERPQNTTLDLRSGRQPERLGTPFESQASYTLEVRSADEGRYNLPTIGLFIWRLRSYVTPLCTPRRVCGDRGYTFDPLGCSEPLFNPSQTATDITQLTREINVPAPLRRKALTNELENLRQRQITQQKIEDFSTQLAQAFDSEIVQAQRQLQAELTKLQSENPEADRYLDLNSRQPAFKIQVDGQPLLPAQIQIETLAKSKETDDWPEHPPTARNGARVAVDPEKGRLWCFGELPKSLEVAYAYGFSGDVGSGTYDRRISIAEAMSQAPSGAPPYVWCVSTADELANAIAQWNQFVIDWQTVPERVDEVASDTLETQPEETQPDSNRNSLDPTGIDRGVILFTHSYTYKTSMAINIPADKQLSLVAANGQRPHIQGGIYARGVATAEDNPGTLMLDGLLIEGPLNLLAGHLKHLQLRHCTLVPTVAGEPNGLRVDALLSAMVRQDEDDLEVSADSGIDRATLLSLWLYLALLIRRIVQIGFDSKRATPEQNIGKLWWLAQQQLGMVMAGLQAVFEVCSTAGDSTLVGLPEYELFQQAIQLPKLLYDNNQLRVTIERSITGPLMLAETVPSLVVLGSLIHQGWDEETTPLALQGSGAIAAFGARTNIETTTIWGRTQVRELSASNSLFTGRVWAQLQQSGCVRFCSLPAGSKTPRRFRAQPDQGLETLLESPLPASVTALIQQPGSQVMWAATAGDGLYSRDFAKTTGADADAAWQNEHLSVMFEREEIAANIPALAMSQSSTTFLAGTATGELLVSTGLSEVGAREWTVQPLSASGQSQPGRIVSDGHIVQGLAMTRDGEKVEDIQTTFGVSVKVGDRITANDQTRLVRQILVEEQQLLLAAPFNPDIESPTVFSTNTGQTTAEITAIVIQPSDAIETGATETDSTTASTTEASATETWFVGTAGGGLFRSTDQGQVWDQLSLPHRQVTCLLAMDNGHLLVGTGGGLFVSEDGGQHWRAADQGLPMVPIICLSSGHPTQVFVGTEKQGIFRSTDGGFFWRRAGLSQWPVTSLIAKHRPTSGTLSSEGVRVTGQQTRFLAELKPGDGLTIENQTRLIKTIEDNVTLTLTQPFCPDILRNESTDGAMPTVGDRSNGLEGTFESTVLIAGTREGGTFRSKDLGETWERVNTGSTTAWVKALAWVEELAGESSQESVQESSAQPSTAKAEPILLATALGSFLYSRDRGDVVSWESKNQGIFQMEDYLQELMRLQPSFTASRYGPAGFGQLMRSCPPEILTGAEDGSEMGAFSYLRQPQREANLLTSLDEYMRFGMTANLFYLT